jgi:hypothetical protein
MVLKNFVKDGEFNFNLLYVIKQSYWYQQLLNWKGT